MKKILFTLAAAMICGFASAQQPSNDNRIEVNARSSREVSPDEVFIKITLDQNDNKGKYTIDQLEKRLYDALKKAGVDADKELKVNDMSSTLKSYLLKKNEGLIAKEYRLKIGTAQLMPVFRELDKAGIPTVEVVGSRFSKYKEVYNELLGEAVTEARQRADIMAKAAGAQVVGVIFIQTYDNTAMYEAAPMAANVFTRKVMVADAGSVPDLEFTGIRIEANITARFVIGLTR